MKLAFKINITIKKLPIYLQLNIKMIKLAFEINKITKKSLNYKFLGNFIF